MTLLVCTGINNYGVNALNALLLKAGAANDNEKTSIDIKAARMEDVMQLRKHPNTFVIQIIPHPVDFIVNQLAADTEHHTYEYWAKIWQKETLSMYKKSVKHDNVLCFSMTDVMINNQSFIASINKYVDGALSDKNLSNLNFNAESFGALTHKAKLDIQTDDIYQDVMLKIPLLGSLEHAHLVEELYIENFLENLSYLPTLSQNTQLLPSDKDNSELESLKRKIEEQAGEHCKEIQLLNNKLELSQQKQEKSFEQYKQLTVEHNQLLVETESKNNEVAAKNTEIESLRAEQELSLLQINKLQEELEQSFTQQETYQKDSEQLQQQLKQAERVQTEITAKDTEIESLRAEQELSLLQINQLQEELEQSFTQQQRYQKDSEQLQQQLKQAERVQTEITAKNTEVENLRADQELSLLQINQLQEELEQSCTQQQRYQKDSEQLQQQLKQAERVQADTESKNSEVANRDIEINDLKAKQELALLQINQLQEELEHYYIQWLEEKQQSPALSKVNLYELGNCTDGARAEGVVLLNSYEQAHYQHLELNINNLYLVDGRKLDSVRLKLVNNSDAIGIEIRKNDNAQGIVSQWPENNDDEFGQYLLFYSEPTEEQKAAQDQTQYSMNTQDRLLVLSIINVLPKLLLANVDYDGVCSATQLRHYKELAITLSRQTDNLPLWTTFDAISLKEEHQSEGYEHLWLTFENLMVGNQLYPHYQLKIAATPSDNSQWFTEQLSLEFRELSNGQYPLQAWPPETEDDFGSVLLTSVEVKDKQFLIDGAELLTKHDGLLLEQLYSNLISIFNKLNYSGTELQYRNWSDWEEVAQQIQAQYIKSQKSSFLKKLIRKISH